MGDKNALCLINLHMVNQFEKCFYCGPQEALQEILKVEYELQHVWATISAPISYLFQISCVEYSKIYIVLVVSFLSLY